MTQLNLFEYLKEKQSPSDPPCYSCIYAIKRGRFRLCGKGHKGYRHIGVWDFCKDRKEPEI